MRAPRRAAAVGLVACVLGGMSIFGAHDAAAVTVNGRSIELLTGAWPRAAHKEGARMSGDGSLVAFSAEATESPFAAPGSTGRHVYARDIATGNLEQISVDSDELGAESIAFAGGMTPDGRFVTFSDWQHPGKVYLDAYVRDRQLGVTEVLSVATDGTRGNGYTQLGDIDISGDGRYVVFSSTASTLVAGDTNGAADVFLRDRVAGTTAILSVREDGGPTNGDSNHPRISADGSTVIFESQSTDLLADGGGQGIFGLDVGDGIVERLSVKADGTPSSGTSAGCAADISSDGSIVTFMSGADDLVPGDANAATDIFVRDRTTETTSRVSVSTGGAEGQFFSGFEAPSMSADGTKIAFVSLQALNPNDPFLTGGVYLRDRVAETTTLISVAADGGAPNADSGYCYNVPGVSIDDAGEAIAFASLATNLVVPPDPEAGYFDVFLSRPATSDGDDDDDGIADAVDVDPAMPSSAFSDGTTFGEVVSNPAGFGVSISDSVDGDQGVRIAITGTGPAEVEFLACGAFTVFLPAGFNGDVTCGSVIVDVAPGSPPARISLSDGLAGITVPGGASAEIDQTADGGFRIENVTGGQITVVVDGVTSTVAPGGTLAGNAWDFDGFRAPVDNGGVPNIAKAGKSVPIKWHLASAAGAPITTLATAKLTVVSVACPTGASADQVEEYVTGSSGLINQGNGNYQLNWQTPASYANSCKTLRLDVGDGVYHTALFRFTK